MDEPKREQWGSDALVRQENLLSRRELLLTSAALLASGGCGGGGEGGTTPTGTVPAALSRLENSDTFYRMLSAGDGFGVQWSGIARALPETTTLSAAGSEATAGIVAKLALTPGYLQDSQYLAYASVLAQTGDRTAVKALTDFLERVLPWDLSYAIDGAAHALKALTNQSGAHTRLLCYTVQEVRETIVQARAWLTAHPEVTQRSVPQSRGVPIGKESCRTRYLLVEQDGTPLTWHDPNQNRTVKVSFDLQRFGYTKAPNTSPSWEQTLGGLEGHIDASDPTPRASPNCAGYAIQEIFGKSGNYSADDLLVRLEGSGAVEKRTSPDFAEVGDLVFYALPGSGAAHVAVVDERLGRPQATYIGVRNKDNASPVFRAALTATYYTGQGWEPRIFTFPQGKPRLILDPDPALATHPNFCQFDAGHVEGVIR